MILLILFSFLAGIITVLSPCILPVLPIILSSSVGNLNAGKTRNLGIIFGFVLSFTFFTLFLSSLVRISGISADFLRLVSIVIIGGFGISLLTPRFQVFLENIFSKLSRFTPNMQNKQGLGGGLLIGFSIGLLWTPCVGPILASVISLALTGTVTLDAFLITLAYSLGTAIPMFLIMIGGQGALKRVPWLTANLANIQKLFGILMILTALGLYFGIDRKFQTFILDTFPNYGTGLTKLEDNELVQKQLDKATDTKQKESENATEVKAPEIIPGGEWFNTEPLTLENLKGKVVIIDFWTYSCINCQRTFPYLRAWHEKYKDKGLVIIGVHSPEFEFEKDTDNVAEAIDDFGLKYPIIQDNDFSTWRAYKNRYWPAKYFVDKDGNIRYTHFGEGAYDESEKIIQELLAETGADNVALEINNPTYEINSKTPELYLGYGRLEHFASPESIVRDKIQTYTAPKVLENNHIAYEGAWLLTKEYANPQAGAKLHLNFEAKEVFLVMKPKKESARVKVYINNKLQNFGEDNIEGFVTVTSDSLYKLIILPAPGRNILRLEFEDGNIEVFAFTFG